MSDRSSDKDLPPLIDVEVPDVLEDVVTLSTDPTKIVAKKTTNAYVHAALATAVTIPLVTGGAAVPSISNIPVRKPDENVPANHQPTAEPQRSLMVAATSASSTFLTGEEFAGSQGEVRYVVHVVHADESPSPAPPLPNLKSTEDDNLS